MRVQTQFIVVKGCYFIQHQGTEAPAVTDATDDTVLFPARTEDPETSGATIITGLFDGPVDITVETGSDVTEPIDGHWEVVNEAQVMATASDLAVSVLFSDPEPSIPPIMVTPGQPYRLRVCIRGYRAGVEAYAIWTGDAVEEHLLQITDLAPTPAHAANSDHEPETGPATRHREQDRS